MNISYQEIIEELSEVNKQLTVDNAIKNIQVKKLTQRLKEAGIDIEKESQQSKDDNDA